MARLALERCKVVLFFAIFFLGNISPLLWEVVAKFAFSSDSFCKNPVFCAQTGEKIHLGN
jgi:hypothetical protein